MNKENKKEVRPVTERNNIDLLELVCQLHSRALNYPSKEMHDAYLEARKEIESRLNSKQSVDGELHPDSEHLLKVCFEELRNKLIKNQNKYGWSNEWLTQNWEDECRKQMMKHIKKGDPRDVAIYAMFMIYRGWSTNAAELKSVSSR